MTKRKKCLKSEYRDTVVGENSARRTFINTLLSWYPEMSRDTRMSPLHD